MADDIDVVLRMPGLLPKGRRVSLASLAPARVTGPAKVSHHNGRWHMRITASRALLRVTVTSGESKRFATMMEIEHGEVLARVPTWELVRELGKRAALDSTAVLADALASRRLPIGSALHEFLGRLAAFRRGASQHHPSEDRLDQAPAPVGGAIDIVSVHPVGDAGGASGKG